MAMSSLLTCLIITRGCFDRPSLRPSDGSSRALALNNKWIRPGCYVRITRGFSISLQIRVQCKLLQIIEVRCKHELLRADDPMCILHEVKHTYRGRKYNTSAKSLVCFSLRCSDTCTWVLVFVCSGNSPFICELSRKQSLFSCHKRNKKFPG